jgi:hypothetical protein
MAEGWGNLGSDPESGSVRLPTAMYMSIHGKMPHKLA